MTSSNEAINAQDLDRLGGLMTEAHRFVDAAGTDVFAVLVEHRAGEDSGSSS